jgi:hypothetical protein
MKRIVWIALILAVLTGSSGNPSAQSRRPDFSGSWRLVSSPGVSGGAPSTLTIAQNDATLNVTVGEQNLTYNLDGSDAQALR